MFKEKFREEMSKILPDDTVKAAILEKIKAEQKKIIAIPSKKVAKKGWISAIAVILVLVIISLTVFDLPNLNGDNFTVSSATSISKDEGQSAPDKEPLNNPPTTSTEDSKESAESNNSQQTITPKNPPKSTTYKAVYALYDEIDALQTEQKEHYGYENSESLGAGIKGPSSNSNSSTSSAPTKNYTETNIQVEGVEEGDIVKTDGKYIYTFGRSDDEINITKATGGKLGKMSCIKIEETPNYELYDNDSYPDIKDLYIYGNTLVAIVSARRKSKSYKGTCTVAMLFDVSNPKTPKCIKQYVQTGDYESTRIIGDKLYVFSSDYTYRIENVKGEDGFYEEKKVWHLPQFGTDNKVLEFIEEENLYIFDGDVNPEYFSIVSIDLNNRKIIDKKSVIGSSDNMYINNNSIYAVSDELNYFKNEGEYKPKTYIMKFSINNGNIIPFAKASVKGDVANQFLMDEYNGYFRIITTTRRYEVICSCGFRRTVGVESNDVFVFNKYLELVGSVNGIAKDETVTSSRFMGEIGYFCTSPQDVNVDPFFAVDFSNPKKPKIIDSLEFPGSVDYLHPYGDNLMLGIGETENGNKVKLIMFDVSNPKKIKQLFTLNTNVSCEYNSFNVSNGHKKVNILKDKDIICFSGGTKYNIYKFSKQKGFSPLEKNQFSAKTDEDGDIYSSWDYNIRGVFIDDYLYVCNGEGIVSYMPFKGNKKISEILFYNYP